MRALTIWQPWASLIIIGAKPFEWRRWRAPAWAIEQEIVIHAGSRRVIMDEIEELIFDLEHDPETSGLNAAPALELLQDVFKGKITLPTAAGLGTAHLGTASLATDIAAAGIPGADATSFPGFIDSNRVDEAIWGWPLTNIQRWAEPMPMKGHQGFWHWPDASTAAADFTPAAIPEKEVPY